VLAAIKIYQTEDFYHCLKEKELDRFTYFVWYTPVKYVCITAFSFPCVCFTGKASRRKSLVQWLDMDFVWSL